jgi:hypothetical protein
MLYEIPAYAEMIKKSMGITKGVWEWQKGCGNVYGSGNDKKNT